ncbi:hypothetical protein BGZ58_010334 [Dissophora ornata]|nr:hypothetical protein BGZ58_010334 [Dissophora ornata]
MDIESETDTSSVCSSADSGSSTLETLLARLCQLQPVDDRNVASSLRSVPTSAQAQIRTHHHSQSEILAALEKIQQTLDTVATSLTVVESQTQQVPPQVVVQQDPAVLARLEKLEQSFSAVTLLAHPPNPNCPAAAAKTPSNNDHILPFHQSTVGQEHSNATTTEKNIKLPSREATPAAETSPNAEHEPSKTKQEVQGYQSWGPQSNQCGREDDYVKLLRLKIELVKGAMCLHENQKTKSWKPDPPDEQSIADSDIFLVWSRATSSAGYRMHLLGLMERLRVTEEKERKRVRNLGRRVYKNEVSPQRTHLQVKMDAVRQAAVEYHSMSINGTQPDLSSMDVDIFLAWFRTQYDILGYRRCCIGNQFSILYYEELSDLFIKLQLKDKEERHHLLKMKEENGKEST